MLPVKEIHLLEFGEMPEIVASAPGRIHLIGENTWFFKDKVLSMAVDITVYVAVSKSKDNIHHFYFHQLNDRKKSSTTISRCKKEDKWANAIKSVVYGFASINHKLPGLNVTVYSQVLPSAGFGITTAIKAAFEVAVNELFNFDCTQDVFVKVLEKGNTLFLQQANHNADNYTALFAQEGTILVTDYYKNRYETLTLDFPDMHIFLVDTKVPRYELWDREKFYSPQHALLLGDLREENPDVYGGWQYISDITDINETLSCVSEDIKRKLICVIREHHDVLESLNACKKGDFTRFARTINHSHESIRDYLNLSCPEIDWILKRVNQLEPNLEFIRNPVTCGRLTGKGFGRALYAFIRTQDIEPFKKKLTEYEKLFGFKCDCYEVHPASGAKVIKD